MRGIFIDPYKRTIAVIDAPSENRTVGMKGLNEVLGADPAYSGVFQHISLGGGVAIWLDDNGCLSAGRPVFKMGETNYAGCAVLFDDDGAGNTVASTLPLSMVTPVVEWTDLETTGDFGPSSEREDGNGFVLTMGQPIFRKREPVEGGSA